MCEEKHTPRNWFYLGLDLGQAADYTALAILESNGTHPATYDLAYIYRPPLKTPYPDIIDQVKIIGEKPLLKDRHTLIVDATGVGAPVIDLLHRHNLWPMAITITGGNEVIKAGTRDYHIPKRDLASCMQVLLQSDPPRLRIARDIEHSATLQNELLNFKVKINVKTGHDSYEAWREGVHDDLVLATALAAWMAENHPSGIGPGILTSGRRRYHEMDIL